MGAHNSAPKSNGANAIDIWMLGCVIMVFAELCEYGVVLFIKCRQGISIEYTGLTTRGTKRQKLTSSKYRKTNNSGNIMEENVGSAHSRDACEADCKGVDSGSEVEKRVKDIDVKKIDYVSFVVFPIVFLVFILTYLVCYKER